ncbi:nucleotide exchange factor GrpE [Marinicella gelatinilytica]|uniref:nucleotide exchange factor GrpE n=1 Tax=Marinicella gelatinilytica TaxID=2996017 RepID=UPI002260F022|nr:nucleotide exchange factor GrpE [Marinicella gelatinilytica]MCX7543947.1 nucleotide exchange factor GrpE [Marinicella gelatinilytica]
MTDNKHHNDADNETLHEAPNQADDVNQNVDNSTDDEVEFVNNPDSEAADSEELAQRIKELEMQLAAKDEEVLRVAAEGMNAQKRLQRELENTRKYANEKLIKAMVPVMDSFDKALEIVEDQQVEVTVESMVEGTINTQQSLAKVLQEYGIEIINPLGEKFDPEIHEAMSMVKSDQHEKNTVVDVFQKGYLLHGRVIRAAMVVVAQ